MWPAQAVAMQKRLGVYYIGFRVLGFESGLVCIRTFVPCDTHKPTGTQRRVQARAYMHSV